MNWSRGAVRAVSIIPGDTGITAYRDDDAGWVAPRPEYDLRVRIESDNPIRRQGLSSMLSDAGHSTVSDAPDVIICDATQAATEAEAPVIVLSDGGPVAGSPAGVLPADASLQQLDLAIRAVAAGLMIRPQGFQAERGFAPVADDPPLLTAREREVLALVGKGMSNKEVARALRISVHTVKFHLEALFAKLDAGSRAEAVAKGLVGRVIEL